MVYYPLIKKGASSAEGMGHRRLPTFYMEDFSVLGFRVDDCERALAVLDRQAYGWRRVRNCTEIAIESPTAILDVVRLLSTNGLKCDLADIADGMYQG